ncbi:uncharacterized protein LOC113212251 [Frankliniella occidentalis]|uniref:Uncharacterized protein LOC113212251 n=1 Tax=Frankliniella occidentalis TaxID=133901 RepID=A0A6J1T0C6_FRAOC|nr:uncharacterized protein LOC113212251 [Frankliniella occidentalis]
MNVNLTLDQHQLCMTPEGALVPGDVPGTFIIYDTLNNRTLNVPMEHSPKVVGFLAAKPKTIIQNVLANNEDGAEAPAASEDCSSEIGEIWIKNSGKPSPLDVQARDDLISLYGSEKYQALMADKKTTKKRVWEMLADEMKKKGYLFGDRDAGKVCSQKWRNMEGETLKVLAAAGPNNTGGGQVKKPSYFEEVHAVVKDKAKAVPKNLQDSLASSSSQDVSQKISDDEEEPRPSDAASEVSPFLKVQTSSQPKRSPNNLEILKFLKEDAEKKDRQNENLIQFLKKKARKDDKRKRSFLSVLERIAGAKKSKTDDQETESSEEGSSSD